MSATAVSPGEGAGQTVEPAPTGGAGGRRPRPAGLRWAVAVLAVLGVGAASVLALGPGSGPSAGGVVLRGPSDPFGIALSDTRANLPYTVGGIPLCMEEGSGAVVDEVTAADGATMRVTGFALRPFPRLSLGPQQLALEDAGFGGDRSVSGSCARGQGSELALELVKSSDATARLDEVVVSWHAGTQTGTVTVPMHFVLCRGAAADEPSCQALQ